MSLPSFEEILSYPEENRISLLESKIEFNLTRIEELSQQREALIKDLEDANTLRFLLLKNYFISSLSNFEGDDSDNNVKTFRELLHYSEEDSSFTHINKKYKRFLNEDVSEKLIKENEELTNYIVRLKLLLHESSSSS